MVDVNCKCKITKLKEFSNMWGENYLVLGGNK